MRAWRRLPGEMASAEPIFAKMPRFPGLCNCRGIDIVRNKIKMFAQKKVTLPPGRHKIVILDEADRFTPPHLTLRLRNCVWLSRSNTTSGLQ